MATYSIIDIVFLSALLLFVFISAGLMQAGIMTLDTFVTFTIIAFIIAISRPLSIFFWKKSQDKYKGKNIYEYWTMVKEQMTNAREKQNYNTILLPPEFVPRNMTIIPNLNLFLAELNRDEFIRTGGDPDYWHDKWKITTIVLNTDTGTIKDQYRGMDILTTIRHINQNIGLHAELKQRERLPEVIKEVIMGNEPRQGGGTQ
jgi:hypothetical protein